ncbi:MAG TPA: hypothetical protein RMH99_32845 [Sandaracinaceae bacterium LLY-WYZ-13_1]|nr:hypothetical protein [Sandaracinaceae bacterium LLY-WYZ-13_1]
MPSPTRTRCLVRAEGGLALALASGLLAAVGARLTAADTPEVAWLLAPMLGLLGALVGSRTHAPARDRDAETTWAAVGGTFVAVPCAFGVASTPSLCLALFVAVPCGLLLNAVWVSLLGRLSDLDGRSAEDGDLARVLAGSWLLCFAVVGALVAAVRRDPYLATVASLAVAVGGHRWLVGSARRRRRAAWLASVTRGEVPGWRLVPIRAVGPERAATLPALTRGPGPWRALLETTAAGPYREGPGGVARARVPAPAPASPAGPSVRWHPPSAAARATFATLGAFFVPFLGLGIGLFLAEPLARAPFGPARPGHLVGWLLVLSGPLTGSMLAALARLAPPARDRVVGVGLGTYVLVAAAFCFLLGLGPHC